MSVNQALAELAGSVTLPMLAVRRGGRVTGFDGALVEAVSIAAEARTAAILDIGHPPAGPAITGTGTDCIVVTAPCDGEPEPWAGLHTAVGEAIGAAVYAATREGAEEWLVDNARAFLPADP